MTFENKLWIFSCPGLDPGEGYIVETRRILPLQNNPQEKPLLDHLPTILTPYQLKECSQNTEMSLARAAPSFDRNCLCPGCSTQPCRRFGMRTACLPSATELDTEDTVINKIDLALKISRSKREGMYTNRHTSEYHAQWQKHASESEEKGRVISTPSKGENHTEKET